MSKHTKKLDDDIVLKYLALYRNDIAKVWRELEKQVPDDFNITYAPILVNDPRTMYDIVRLENALSTMIQDYKDKLVREGKLTR